MVFLNLGGVPIEFPFQPYDVQEKFMEKVIECLQKVYDLHLLIFVYKSAKISIFKGS